MEFPEGNGVVGADGKVHSDYHLDVEMPDTAHQISHGFLSFLLFLTFYLRFFVLALRVCVLEVGWISFFGFLFSLYWILMWG